MSISLTSILLDRMAIDIITHICQGRIQSSHHDRMAHPLHLTMEGTNPLTMLEWLWISALISDMEGTNPLTMKKWLSPYILPWKEPILSPCQNGYGTHHFPLEEILIWRTPSFCLKYSNFTLANGFINTLVVCSSITTYWGY